MSLLKRFSTETIAIVLLIVMTTTSMAIAASTGSTLDMSEITEAGKAQRNIFIIYVLSLALTVLLSVLVWRSNNKYQDSVNSDAKAKIATAEAISETARKEAAEANKTAKEVEQQNLILRTDLNTSLCANISETLPSR